MDTQHTLQEIKDLFARFGSGDYQPTTEEVAILDETLLAILHNHDSPGPTGKAPVVNDPNDKGELRAFLNWEPAGTLLLRFGKPITFLRMDRDQAIALMHGIEGKLNER